MSTVTIALAADGAYARPLAVAAYSVLARRLPDTQLDICVLDAGIEAEDRRRIEDSLRAPGVEVMFSDPLADRVASLPNTWPSITRATYARLFLPEILPDRKRVLYLDCDTMARRDLSEFFDVDMGDNLAMGVLDVQKPFVPFEVPLWCDDGRRPDEWNFNCGVMLVDLDGWREEDVSARTIEYLVSDRFLRAQDQEAINAVIGARIGQIDPRWNQQYEIFWKGIEHGYDVLLPFDQREMQQLKADPWIVHFSNQPKPWAYGYDHPFAGEWYANLDATEYRGWRPTPPSYLNQQVTKWGRRGMRVARRAVAKL